MDLKEYGLSGGLKSFFLQAMIKGFLSHGIGYASSLTNYIALSSSTLQILDWNLPKPSLKIGTAKRHLLELSWHIQRLRLKKYFFRNKTFLFSRQKVETFTICLKQNFVKPYKISTHSAYSDNCYFHFFYRLSDKVEIL